MDHQELFIKMALLSWKSNAESVNKFLDKISEEDVNKEVAPGRNKVGWIIGHLSAVNDDLPRIFGVNHVSDPALQAQFKSGEKDTNPPYSLQKIKTDWATTLSAINNVITGFTDEDWFSRHALVSEEDFKKEPHRNKLNVLLSRATHISYHVGQLSLVKPYYL